MDTKQIMEHQIIICDDLTDQEKFNALEVLETLTEDFAKFLLFESVDEVETLYEFAGDDDVAAYKKYRNKLKKMTGQKVRAAKASIKKASTKGAASTKGVAKFKKASLGSKIAAKVKKVAAAAKASKAGVVAKKAAPKVYKISKLTGKVL